MKDKPHPQTTRPADLSRVIAFWNAAVNLSNWPGSHIRQGVGPTRIQSKLNRGELEVEGLRGLLRLPRKKSKEKN